MFDFSTSYLAVLQARLEHICCGDKSKGDNVPREVCVVSVAGRISGSASSLPAILIHSRVRGRVTLGRLGPLQYHSCTHS
jgi:hypothetical protein